MLIRITTSKMSSKEWSTGAYQATESHTAQDC